MTNTLIIRFSVRTIDSIRKLGSVMDLLKSNSSDSFSTGSPIIVDISDTKKEVVERLIEELNDVMIWNNSCQSLEDISLNTDDENDVFHPCNSDIPQQKRVSFPEELVCDVWERPFTTCQEKTTLFYSRQEIATFRMEYRKMLRAQKEARLRELGMIPPSSSSSTMLDSYPMSLTGFSSMTGMLRKALQVTNSLSQTGTFFSLLGNQEETSDAMLVVDTLYLF
jgi:hypothetical protein